MKSAVELTTEIMKLGFNRDEAGTLAQYVYQSIKHKDNTFIRLGCKMFKDNRTNQWGNDSGLDQELIRLFNV